MNSETSFMCQKYSFEAFILLPFPICYPKIAHEAYSIPNPNIYKKLLIFISTIWAACSGTLKYPLKRIISSQTHQSKNIMSIDGIAI